MITALIASLALLLGQSEYPTVPISIAEVELGACPPNVLDYYGTVDGETAHPLPLGANAQLHIEYSVPCGADVFTVEVVWPHYEEKFLFEDVPPGQTLIVSSSPYIIEMDHLGEAYGGWHVIVWQHAQVWHCYFGACDYEGPAVTGPVGVPVGTGGDINLDGAVNVQDLLLLLASWGPAQPATEGHAPADLNADGVVNVADLLILLENWSA